ncbi:hypothetical protein F4821DRAFT_150749 [Hypoxylon rubiginosum]|uniref:Uncharacterized protein n=1 Tax=Hypoxylon rubiginosum TaxID=110542 RepID=A0ACC0CYG3_9PEZI|nr:hypothetical protein F4821DRAFT_150749 [Hypoxylon rubiginosum]
MPCPETAHSVAPLFKQFELIPEMFGPGEETRAWKEQVIKCFFCKDCKLSYIMGSDSSIKATCPSHVLQNRQRYVAITVTPLRFYHRIDIERVECSAALTLGPSGHRVNAQFNCFSRPDPGDADGNLDNMEIAAIIKALEAVEERMIPHRQRVTEKAVYTNSSYFAGQAWRFQLVLMTPTDPNILSFLIEAHKLQYSFKRKAFVERNSRGSVTKKYPVTEERRYQVASFIRSVKRLASVFGIQVHLAHTTNFKHAVARENFKNPMDVIPKGRNLLAQGKKNKPPVPPARTSSLRHKAPGFQDKSKGDKEEEEEFLAGDSLKYLSVDARFDTKEQERADVADPDGIYSASPRLTRIQPL